jgi:EAL domain-containing protein (putative c-di-GMP-specific phosphodiesterase class I)
MEQLERTGVSPRKFCFEITETAAIADMSGALHFISTLQKIGCSFARDDFGSGLSSFNYLKTLRVDYVKIDGFFVKDIIDDPVDFAMVKSIHEIATLMGKRTIAEFVETEEIRKRLADLGVHFMQGYAISYPQSLDKIGAKAA